jgi:SAM-dependent methyltransferase
MERSRGRRSWRDAARAAAPLARFETRRWEHQRQRLLELAVDDPAARERFRAHAPLAPGYAANFDERVVELPWVFAQEPGGRVLDAGSALNHQWLLRRLLPRVDELHVVTLAPEPQSFNSLGVSYLYADLRDLPLRDGIYDTVISVSTLEHVGMDNTSYGAAHDVSSDAREASRQAVRELRRVVAPGGRMLITVPFGRAEQHGWLRQFDRGQLDELIDAAGPADVEIAVWRNSGGWQPVEPAAAADARYGEHKAEAVAVVAIRV